MQPSRWILNRPIAATIRNIPRGWPDSILARTLVGVVARSGTRVCIAQRGKGSAGPPLWTGRTSRPPPRLTTGLVAAVASAASRSGASKM